MADTDTAREAYERQIASLNAQGELLNDQLRSVLQGMNNESVDWWQAVSGLASAYKDYAEGYNMLVQGEADRTNRSVADWQLRNESKVQGALFVEAVERGQFDLANEIRETYEGYASELDTDYIRSLQTQDAIAYLVNDPLATQVVQESYWELLRGQPWHAREVFNRYPERQAEWSELDNSPVYQDLNGAVDQIQRFINDDTERLGDLTLSEDDRMKIEGQLSVSNANYERFVGLVQNYERHFSDVKSEEPILSPQEAGAAFEADFAEQRSRGDTLDLRAYELTETIKDGTHEYDDIAQWINDFHEHAEDYTALVEAERRRTNIGYWFPSSREAQSEMFYEAVRHEQYDLADKIKDGFPEGYASHLSQGVGRSEVALYNQTQLNYLMKDEMSRGEVERGFWDAAVSFPKQAKMIYDLASSDKQAEWSEVGNHPMLVELERWRERTIERRDSREAILKDDTIDQPTRAHLEGQLARQVADIARYDEELAIMTAALETNLPIITGGALVESRAAEAEVGAEAEEAAVESSQAPVNTPLVLQGSALAVAASPRPLPKPSGIAEVIEPASEPPIVVEEAADLAPKRSLTPRPRPQSEGPAASAEVAVVPPAADEPVVASQADMYTVKKGDSLWAIAQAELDDGNRWQELYDLNRDIINDPSQISPGMKLKLSQAAEMAVTAQAAVPASNMERQRQAMLEFVNKGYDGVVANDVPITEGFLEAFGIKGDVQYTNSDAVAQHPGRPSYIGQASYDKMLTTIHGAVKDGLDEADIGTLKGAGESLLRVTQDTPGIDDTPPGELAPNIRQKMKAEVNAALK